MDIPCPRDGRQLALACQLCPISPTYWNPERARPIDDPSVRCRVIGRDDETNQAEGQ